MREGHFAMAEMLLQSGVERNIFTMAAMGDVKGMTSRLRRVRADARLTADMEPASNRVTPLHVACASDWKSHGRGRMAVQTQVARTLADHGADLNALACYRGIGVATPLFCACWSSENLLLVRWLLDHGATTTDACLPAAQAIFNVTVEGHSTSRKYSFPRVLPSITEPALDAPFCKHSLIKETTGPWRG